MPSSVDDLNDTDSVLRSDRSPRFTNFSKFTVVLPICNKEITGLEKSRIAAQLHYLSASRLKLEFF